jgi:hypothetical protein
MNKSIMGIALAGVLVTSACASAGGQKSGEATGTNRPAETVTVTAPSSSSPTSEDTPSEDTSSSDEAPSTELHFGNSFSYEDGLNMTISKPKNFTSSEYNSYQKGVKFKVTIVNKTGKRWDPTMFTASLQKGNTEAEEIYDSFSLGDSPNTKLLNGREVTFNIGFVAKATDDLVLEVAPDFEHESVIYTK